MPAQKATVLICDDSLLIRHKLKEELNRRGLFNVLEASDGQTAINLYEEHRPVVVFMDIVMPVRDGLDALKVIKDIDREAKVIMMSSSGTQGNLKKAVEAGASDFIQKPWNDSQLDGIIEKTLKERVG